MLKAKLTVSFCVGSAILLTIASIYVLVKEDTLEVYCRQHIGESFGSCEAYAAHAINSHDELVAENERLRIALERATNHSPDAGNKAGGE